MPDKPLLPIKVVFPSDSDYKEPDSGGGGGTEFVAVTPELREQLSGQALDVQKHFKQSFLDHPDVPAVARVGLRREALAKSHRPTELFNKETCPVIGVGDVGQLLVSITDHGIAKVAEAFKDGTTQTTAANISAVESISPWTDEDARGGETADQIAQRSTAQKRPAVRCKLFRHNTPEANEAVRRAFLATVHGLGLPPPKEIRYSHGSTVYAVKATSGANLKAIARFAGVQSVSSFPTYRIVRATAHVLGSVTADRLPPPEAGASYGTVGLVDSGTDPNNPHLQAWVESRFDWVPQSEQENTHGSFVAGLIARARPLNHGDQRFPANSCRIVDVVAFDKGGEADEQDLLDAIDEAIDRYPRVKVWNLSLALEDCCHESEFSDFAAALDERSRAHGILFVVAAGNYEVPPLRGWPPPDKLDTDRICPPADSVRALTVGSIAHKTSAATLVQEGEPSPFSRRGPAPGFLVKPELMHYGGNCSSVGEYVQTGVISVNGKGALAELVGTSLATPLVSTLAGGVWNELDIDPKTAHPLLVKALAVHSAFLRRVPQDLREMHYLGVGVPEEVGTTVACSQSSATLILQIPLSSQGHFEKRHFPMPSSLEGPSGLRGEVFMTLAHDCPLDQNFGFEYCRSNVDVSLGVYRHDTKTGRMRQKREVHPVPRDPGRGFESDLIKHGYKWSPMKLYYRRFQRGPVDEEWRLRISRLDRAEFTEPSDQTVFLVLTIRDATGKARVYDDVVRSMNQLGWRVQDLRIRSRPRLQT